MLVSTSRERLPMETSYPGAAAYRQMLQQYAPLIDALPAHLVRRSSDGVGVAPIATAELAASGDTVTLTQVTAGVEHAMTLVQQEMDVLQSVPWSGFTGSGQMRAAVSVMQQALAGWPAVASQVSGLADSIVHFDTESRAAITSATNADVAAVAKSLHTDFAQVKSLGVTTLSAVQKFNSTVSTAYQRGATANQAAASNIAAEQQAIQLHIRDLQAQIDDLQSAGSIILGILTLGIKTAVDISNLKNKIAALHGEEARWEMDRSGYQAALSGFMCSFQAVHLLNTALDTFNLAMEQLGNKLNDALVQSSSNPTLALALLQVFQSEVDAAAAAASAIGGSSGN